MSGNVLDASVAVAALTEPGSPAAELLSGDDAVFHAPSIFDAEVLSALRGLVREGKFGQAGRGRPHRRISYEKRTWLSRL